MDKMAFDRGNPQEEPPRRVAKKSKKRFLWLTLVALLAMIAVVLSILYDRGEFDGLRRRVLYAKAQKDENGCAQLYRYASDRQLCLAGGKPCHRLHAPDLGAGRGGQERL